MSDVRNSARYCDGQSRQHTVRFPGAGIRGADLFAAVAGQTCGDPLDCVALTEGEAVAVGEAWARKRTTMLATDLRAMFRVVPLPEGWSNDGCPVHVAMVAQPVQQQQANAGPAMCRDYCAHVADYHGHRAHELAFGSDVRAYDAAWEAWCAYFSRSKHGVRIGAWR